ncbi:MAG: hypothetical protein JHC61_04255, partial [Burkholderiaceae bacterium]|nr:hypothetical protein [Burkholderiaceae bacterium]
MIVDVDAAAVAGAAERDSVTAGVVSVGLATGAGLGAAGTTGGTAALGASGCDASGRDVARGASVGAGAGVFFLKNLNMVGKYTSRHH